MELTSEALGVRNQLLQWLVEHRILILLDILGIGNTGDNDE